MPQFTPSDFLQALDRCVPAAASGRLCVAFSGGLDSTVLLRAVSDVVRDNARYSAYAVHVDHQLHPQSRQWQQHCASAAQVLGLDFLSRGVRVEMQSEGVEAGARIARYAALRECMQRGDTLLTAHHADDQLETLLLALVRGSGVAGLSAMAACQEFAPGWHARPLLQYTRTELASWATQQGLNWLHDPSNDATRFDRNYLRQEVISRLRARWPAVAHSSVRSAAHLSDAEALLRELANADLRDICRGAVFSVAAWQTLSAARRRNALRGWLRSRGVRMPSTRKLAALEHDILCAAPDRSPRVSWDGVAVYRHRGWLYLETQELASLPESVPWRWSSPLALPGALGILRIEPARTQGLALARLPEVLEVRFRTGGEVIRPAGDAHQRRLKTLLQAAAILPWWRSRLPLIYANGQLAAVGDLWIEQEFVAEQGGVRIIWEDKPLINAMAELGD